MPILDNWIDSPLNFITDSIENSGELKISTIKEYFEERVKSLNNINEIPCLNDVPAQNIKPNSLVRFRCMVQDQFDPEYYLGLYETLNRSNGHRRTRLGIFRDTSDCQKEEEIIYESKKNVTLERQSLYCVPVPGQNTWAKFHNASRNLPNPSPTEMEDQERSNKRGRDEEMEEDPNETDQIATDNLKKQRSSDKSTAGGNDAASSSGSRDNYDLNFPLPDEKGTPCLAIIYDTEEESIKLNEVVEFVGILSCDPILAAATMNESESHEGQSQGMMPIEECSAHCPPSSLVPRLHCILSRRLKHSNPMLTEDIAMEHQNLESECADIREIIVQSLSRLLYGDRLAAEFVLLNLISRVYGSVDVMALGKFSLNLTKCPSAAEPSAKSFPSEVGKFFEMITTKSHCIPLTISNLNTQKFVPRKDYNANRLVSGCLQLSEGTHLVLDETVLEPGQLDATGVQNVTAIGNVIQWQKVEYEFSFHRCEMKTDITVLVLSEARSLMQCDCLLPLKRQEASFQSAESILGSLDPGLIDKIRIFLDVVRLMEYRLTDEMQEAVKEDYVEMRESDPKSINPDTFHLLLVMARLIALSFGKDSLTTDLWNKTKQLEGERRQRCL